MKRKLQVFVSSTYTDLVGERQAAVSAILKSGHIPAGMELFTAGDKSQLEIIKRWIDESDVLMLILGGRYGSVDPISGVSYTELEYNYALEIGKPLFAVVLNEGELKKRVKRYGETVIETDRPVELKLFREKVLSNMSSFFDDLKDIRLAVMESLPELAATRDLIGWVSGNEVPDTKGLVDEISRLNFEIADLVKENAILSKKLASNTKITSEKEFEELKKILESIEIKIPSKIVEQKEDLSQNLYVLFNSLKDYFVTGVTNQINQNDSTYFIYNNVCPKLQIHGLVQNDKVPSVNYRRFSITKRGQEFLAYIDKTKLKSN